MKIKIILILAVFAFGGCGEHISTSKSSVPNPINYAEPSDSTLNGNIFCHFLSNGDTAYNIEWGCNAFKNVSKETYKVLGNGKLTILAYNNTAIILSQGCGTSCRLYVVLLMKKGAVEKSFMGAIAYNINNNNIAYTSEEDMSFVKIANYITEKEIGFWEKDLCPAASLTECIDTAYFKSDSFIIVWQGSKWQRTKADTRIRRIFIGG